MYLGFYLVGGGVDNVFCVFPHLWRHLNHISVVGAAHVYFLGVERCNDAYLAVVVFALRIVLYEHHLCALAQGELFVGGVGVFGKVAINIGIVFIFGLVETCQFAVVVSVGSGVVCG